MNNIDFLPKRYHEQGVRRKSQLWRIILLVLFGGVCAATAVGQQILRRSVKSQLDAIAAEYASANATNQMFDRIQADLKDANASAELYAFLQHPWPRTQILASLSKPLDETIYLSQLHVYDETVKANLSSHRSSRPGSKSEPDTAKALNLPSQADLKRLDSALLNKRTVISIVGKTTDIAALHKYVAELKRADLFTSAKLVSLQSIEDDARQAVSQFRLRVLVRPSHTLETTATSGSTPASSEIKGDA